MGVLNRLHQKWWVLIGVSIASFLGCIDFTIVNTALPAIQQSLNASVIELQWIINIFILALSTFMVIMGRLADVYGRRLVLYVGMVVFGLASLGAGLVNDIYWLIFFRLIQGISCAILYTASGAIVFNAFPANERGKAIGTLFGVNGIGLAIGPVIGGFIISALSWRWVFLINVPLIMVSLIICFANVEESRAEDGNKKIDWLGLVTLMIALPSLVLTMIQGDSWGFTSSLTLTLLSLAILGLILFFIIEMRASSPIIQFHLFANRMFIAGIIATFTLAFFYCLAFFLMPLYLNLIRAESGYMIGIMLLPTTAMVALFSPIVGRIVDRIGPKLPLIVGLALFVLSALLQTKFGTDSSLVLILSAFVLMGIGWACILGPSTVAALSSVPENMSAVAMGSSWTLHNIGGALGLALGIVVYRSQAVSTLLDSLSQYASVNGDWLKQAVSDPELAASILQEQFQMTSFQATRIIQEFFIAGYQSAMWLLTITSLVALMLLLVGIRNKAK